MNYEIYLVGHYPHDRFALGWEYITKDKDFNYNTLTLYCLIFTITINYETNK